MGDDLPAVSGVQLMRLLEKDGWKDGKHGTHGVVYIKHSRSTIVPNKRKSLPKGTLATILSEKQTGLGRAGLLALIDKHGL